MQSVYDILYVYTRYIFYFRASALYKFHLTYYYIIIRACFFILYFYDDFLWGIFHRYVFAFLFMYTMYFLCRYLLMLHFAIFSIY